MLAIGLTLLIAAGVYYTYVTFIATRGSEDLTVPANAGRSETLDREAPLATQASAHPSPAWQELYPGELLPARQWADPRGSLDLKLPELEGFTPISAAGRPSFVGEIGRAERITIPAIGVGAGVGTAVGTGLAVATATGVGVTMGVAVATGVEVGTGVGVRDAGTAVGKMAGTKFVMSIVTDLVIPEDVCVTSAVTVTA